MNTSKREFFGNLFLCVTICLFVSFSIATVRAEVVAIPVCNDAGGCVGTGIPGFCGAFSAQCTTGEAHRCRCRTDPNAPASCICWAIN